MAAAQMTTVHALQQVGHVLVLALLVLLMLKQLLFKLWWLDCRSF